MHQCPCRQFEVQGDDLGPRVAARTHVRQATRRIRRILNALRGRTQRVLPALRRLLQLCGSVLRYRLRAPFRAARLSPRIASECQHPRNVVVPRQSWGNEPRTSQERSAFFAEMSHEGRIPLLSLYSYMSLLLHETMGPLTAGQREIDVQDSGCGIPADQLDQKIADAGTNRTLLMQVE